MPTPLRDILEGTPQGVTPINLKETNLEKIPSNAITFSQTKPSVFTATQGQYPAIFLLKNPI